MGAIRAISKGVFQASTPREFNMFAPKNRQGPKRKLIFQASFLVDVGFVNQNSGFINQRFDNQGSTTKVRQLKTAVSSTKVRQPKSRIRQPRGSSTKKVGFVNQKRRIHQPRFVNQGSSTKNTDSSTKDSSTKTTDSSTKRFVNQKSWIRPKTADSKVPEHF